MSGKLYGVGVGPGDPELLTLKAVRIINEAEIIALPKTDEQNITALEIVKQVIDITGKEIIELYLPMTREADVLANCQERAADLLAKKLDTGQNVVFLTLGDPTIYSTYFYIQEWIIRKGHEAQLVPGVTSFCAVAAKLNTSLCLGAEPLHIVPASYQDTSDYLDWEGTKILMKSGKSLVNVIEALRDRDLLKNSSLVERCGMEGERVVADLTDFNFETFAETSYFSTIVIKSKNKNKNKEND